MSRHLTFNTCNRVQYLVTVQSSYSMLDVQGIKVRIYSRTMMPNLCVRQRTKHLRVHIRSTPLITRRHCSRQCLCSLGTSCSTSCLHLSRDISLTSITPETSATPIPVCLIYCGRVSKLFGWNEALECVGTLRCDSGMWRGNWNIPWGFWNVYFG